MKNLYIITIVLMGFINPVKITAQNYDSLRTNTWSIYGQAGMSWAIDNPLKNVNPSTGTKTAVDLGLGINYNIRPWVRLGINYEFSKFKAEQRFSEFQETDAMMPQISNPQLSQLIDKNGGIAYRKQWTDYHNVSLTAEFNIMEFWKNRECKKFNIYAGTGLGVMFAHGNIYTLGMGSEKWADPDNTMAGNTTLSWVKSYNVKHDFTNMFLPLNLSAEYDILPKLTIGIKYDYKVIFNRNKFAPKGITATALSIRYNFVGDRQGVKSNKKKYNELASLYNDSQRKYKELASLYEKEKLNNECENYIEDLRQENKNLIEKLDANQRNSIKGLTVQFDVNCYTVSDSEKENLKKFAANLEHNNLTDIVLVAEASADGNSEKNRVLSKNRLESVISILKENGISEDKIKFKGAYGDRNKNYDPTSRRVIISIEK